MMINDNTIAYSTRSTKYTVNNYITNIRVCCIILGVMSCECYVFIMGMP